MGLRTTMQAVAIRGKTHDSVYGASIICARMFMSAGHLTGNRKSGRFDFERNMHSFTTRMKHFSACLFPSSITTHTSRGRLLRSIRSSAVCFALGLLPIAVSGQYLVTDLTNLIGTNAELTAINNSGVIIGESGGRGFVLREGAISQLGTLGGSTSDVTGINNLGVVVGYSETASGITHAFVWENGVMTDLSPLSDTGTYAHDINDHGVVVGEGTPAGSDYTHALRWSNGMVTDLGTFGGGPESSAVAINNSGVIAATYSTFLSHTHPVVLNGGTVVEIPGGTRTYVSGINESGTVVGTAHQPYLSIDAYIFENGIRRDLGYLPADFPGSFTYSMGWGINNSGAVVGESNGLAFLFEEGTMTDLNSLVDLDANASLLRATAINDQGQIIANGSNGRYYLLTPASTAVPEASTYGGFGVLALFGMIAVRRWHRSSGCAS